MTLFETNMAICRRNETEALTDRLRTAIASSIDALVVRLGKHELRANRFGSVSFSSDGDRFLVLKYSDVGVAALTGLIKNHWPTAVDIAFHDGIDELEVDFSRVYRCKTGWMGALYVEHYTP